MKPGGILARLFFSFLLVAGIFFANVHHAAAANGTLYLTPANNTVASGSNFTIALRENSGITSVVSTEVNIAYPSNLLDFVSFSGASAFPLDLGSTGGGGSISIAKLGFGGVTGDRLVTNITFKAKASGVAAVTILNASYVSTFNSDLVLTKTSGSYTIPGAPQPPPPPTPTPTPSPQPPPPPTPTPTPSPKSLPTPTPSPTPSPKSLPTPTPSPPVVIDNVVPTITDVRVEEVSFGSVTVYWLTSEPATSEVRYGLGDKYEVTAAQPALTTNHKVTLDTNFLIGGMNYNYLVVSSDTAGNQGLSEPSSFRTLGAQLKVTILNKENQPVSGAKVSIADLDYITDIDGIVVFSNLPIGEHIVSIEANGKKSSTKINIDKLQRQEGPYELTIHVGSSPNLLLPILAVMGGIGLLIASPILLRLSKKHKIFNKAKIAKPTLLSKKSLAPTKLKAEKQPPQQRKEEIVIEPLHPTTPPIIGSGPLFPPGYHYHPPSQVQSTQAPLAKITPIDNKSESMEDGEEQVSSRINFMRKYLTTSSSKKPLTSQPSQKAPSPQPLNQKISQPSNENKTNEVNEVVVVIKHDK